MQRAALLLVALLPAAAAAQTAYRIDPARTHAEFDVEHLGVFRAHGRFESVSGTLQYDPSAQSGLIDIAIPVASVSTGWDSRDSFLRGSTMFDGERYPRMRFRSTRFVFDGGRVARVDGELTLRDVTRPVTFVVKALRCEHDACVAEAAGAIRRRDFGMDNWWPLIGDEVELGLRLYASRE